MRNPKSLIKLREEIVLNFLMNPTSMFLYWILPLNFQMINTSLFTRKAVITFNHFNTSLIVMPCSNTTYIVQVFSKSSDCILHTAQERTGKYIGVLCNKNSFFKPAQLAAHHSHIWILIYVLTCIQKLHCLYKL